ncbi:winged helix-turn-helix domain-containing protein [Apilactobacillus micheneri]|uniref:winged helix-turn-helix domain-containing protein n=1 Tax=Apilactobacillus micheneri TaxID=1899430 RepID=UPI000D034A13|nr:winged helix-turn-helix domain-containing protein [Apilactobacillus micheneri]
MGQFIKLYSEFSAAGLKPNEMIVLANLYDRMDLSYKNEGFYDGKQHAYYITFTREDLAKKVNVGIATITRVFKTLAKKGWIIIKQRFNSSNRIFLPISLKSKNDSSKVSNLDSNQTKAKQTYTNETDVTRNQTKNKQIAMPKTEIGNEENKQIHISGFDRMQNLVDSLKQKACFGHDLINILVKYSENTGVLYNYAQLIFKAKKTVISKLVKNGRPEAKDALRFENNINLMPELSEFMKSLIIKTRCTKSIKNVAGYITKALHEFFTDAVGGYMSIERHAHLSKNTKDFNIPIIQLDK